MPRLRAKPSPTFLKPLPTPLTRWTAESPLSDDERQGRNTWLLWTAGDQVFWDRMAQHGLGTADLLKTIDSRLRNSRFKDMGLVNQPGFEQAAQPDEYGLWLDTGPQEDGVDRGGVRKTVGHCRAERLSQSQVR